MSKLDELGAAAKASFKTQCEAAEAYQLRLGELQKQAREQAEAEDVGKAYRAAQAAHNKAVNELRAEENKNRVQNGLDRLANLHLVEGAILVEWRMPRYSSQGHYSPTGKKGILQVVRPGDEFATNRMYSRPSVGSVIVRLLRKDGSVGLNYGIYEDAWLPEGVLHPRAVSACCKEATR